MTKTSDSRTQKTRQMMGEVSAPDPKPGAAVPGDRLVVWLGHFRHFGWDIVGVACLAAAAVTLLGLFGHTEGVLVTPWVNLLQFLFGWGGPLLGVLLVFLGWAALRRSAQKPVKWNLMRVLALELAALAGLAFLSLLGGRSLLRVDERKDGGIVGWGLAELVDKALPAPWGSLVLVILFFLGLAVGLGFFAWLGKKIQDWANQVDPEDMVQLPLPMESPQPVQTNAPVPAPQPVAAAAAPAINPAQKRSTQVRQRVARTPAPQPVSSLPARDQRLPPLDLLIHEPVTRPDEEQIRLVGEKIVQALGEFGVPSRVVGQRIGPTVTQYAVEPGYVEKTAADGEVNRQKVRVSQISGLARDLALRLSAERLRIEAPVPGQSYVGIEVPNSSISMVRLRALLETEAFYKLNSPLAIGLGQDVSGQPVVADLARMPHLLIAGTTGSGKSVCIIAIAACLAMNNTPEELRLAMLDPKMVELVRFNGLPHLMGKVETDVMRMLGVLRWAIAEMDNRYRLLEDNHARDITTYNRKMERRKQPLLPRIVVFIDELADLMMNAPEQTEHNLVRLAQMARAVGIHLVVATQRPSTDVVTGVIKANFPARIAFTVATSIDSRVILDSNGAETLLGRGDMLFLNPESGTPLRAQGVFVTDQELEAVVQHWRTLIPPKPDEVPDCPWDDLLAQDEEQEGHDHLVDEAVKLVRRSQRASASLIQRRLRIGYPRAARLLDELESLGVVGPALGGGREREVLLPPEEDENGEEAGAVENNPDDF